MASLLSLSSISSHSYRSVSSFQDRTNNHAETSHRRIQNELGMNHPTIWKLIKSLKKVQTGHDMEEEQMIAGHPLPTKRRKYHDIDRRISILIEQFVNTNASHPLQTMWEFLKAIAHNFAMDP